jgi:hypothetical protein
MLRARPSGDFLAIIRVRERQKDSLNIAMCERSDSIHRGVGRAAPANQIDRPLPDRCPRRWNVRHGGSSRKYFR